MILRPPRSTQSRSSAASDVYKRQPLTGRLRAITLAHRRVRHPRKPPDGPNVADITPGSIHSGVTFAARRADNGPTANGAPAPPWTRAPAHRLWGRREARLLVLGRDEAAPFVNGLLSAVPDIDPAETNEWIEALDGLVDERGVPRARYILLSLLTVSYTHLR